MSIKGIFAVYNAGEDTGGQIRASCQGQIVNGAGTGATFNQDFNIDLTLPNINAQIAESVKAYLISSKGVTFNAGDVVVMLPALL
jgi:hypothetical protein